MKKSETINYFRVKVLHLFLFCNILSRLLVFLKYFYKNKIFVELKWQI